MSLCGILGIKEHMIRSFYLTLLGICAFNTLMCQTCIDSVNYYKTNYEDVLSSGDAKNSKRGVFGEKGNLKFNGFYIGEKKTGTWFYKFKDKLLEVEKFNNGKRVLYIRFFVKPYIGHVIKKFNFNEDALLEDFEGIKTFRCEYHKLNSESSDKCSCLVKYLKNGMLKVYNKYSKNEKLTFYKNGRRFSKAVSYKNYAFYENKDTLQNIKVLAMRGDKRIRFDGFINNWDKDGNIESQISLVNKNDSVFLYIEYDTKGSIKYLEYFKPNEKYYKMLQPIGRWYLWNEKGELKTK